MGIEFSRSYKASDGKCYSTLKEAQEVEITKILGELVSEVECDQVAHGIVENAEAIIRVLTITDNSRPRARGVKKPRKPKTNGMPPPSYTEAHRQDSLTPA